MSIALIAVTGRKRLNVLERFAGKFVAAYFFNYERLALALETGDG
jgi:hypothetical protein